MKDKFIIIDGNSLIHRAFYALPPLTNREGVFTNAVYGFTNILLRIIEEQKPKYIAVAFDKGKITFRNEIFEDYKGHRKPTPPELRPQFKLVHKLLEALNIPFYELENYEADDIIGAFVKEGEEKELHNIIVTSDKDVLQLISDYTEVILTKKGISQTEFVDIAKVQEAYKLTPQQLIDVKGLMGDASDNIPGVPGVGEKTALKLLQEYGSLEELYRNVDKVSAKKLKEKLMDYKDQAFLSRKLATINSDVPVEFDLDKILCKDPDYDKLLSLLTELEFKSLVSKFLGSMEQEKEYSALKVEPGEFQERHNSQKPLAISMELNLDSEKPKLISALLVSSDLATQFLPSSEEKLLDFFSKNKDSLIIIHDYKNIYKYLYTKGINLNNVKDTAIAAYLLNPSSSKYGLEELALEYLNRALVEGEDPLIININKTFSLIELNDILTEKLKETDMLDLYLKVEMPLIAVLADMEMAGVRIDKKILDEMSKNIEAKLTLLTQEIYDLADEEFNINSPKQLSAVLFDKMDLCARKKIKTGYSTNAEVLEQIALEHPIGEKILTYRHLSKLKSTYVDGLLALINPITGKLHTTFKQTVTATGRLSSVEPNLQNIPIRLEEGRAVRKAFLPSDPGKVILAADYSQIELRILAHLSQDENLMDAFENNEDIHSRTASEVFGVSMKAVTPQMRRSAKAVNFGIVYGISDFGLARDLGIERKEAKKYIDQYFIRYRGVHDYIQNIIAQAREKGYVTTLLNRRRYLQDLFSSNKSIRFFGERTAMNTPIQGSAADIIKLAMIKCREEIIKDDISVTLLLQVHDELIFETPEADYKKAVDLIRYCMEDAYKLSVPLVVDAKVGPNWYDLVKI